MPQRKASVRVTLVLIGAALAGCDSPSEEVMRRDIYANLEDCAKDWGRPEFCEQQAATTSSSSGATRTGYHYYGPWYDDRSAQSRPGSRAVDSVRVSRGGFGASSSLHSSGG
jgi:uncharacterized protein YgiB involved in biofilm formation